MLSSYEKERLKQFYSRAPRCEELQKTSGWRFSSWICGKTGKPCGPRVCPMEDPMEEKPEAEGLLEPQRSEPVEPVEVLPEMGNGRGAQATDREINVIQKNHVKTHTRPRLTPGSTIKRALVTFVSRTGEVRRWPFDCIFSSRRQPRILEFQGKVQRKNMKNARFYFPIQATNQDVRNLVGSWFVSLQVHDESASLNIMGSPTAFSVDLVDEA